MTYLYIYIYIPHVVLAWLMGIHCEIITVSKVSVAAGGSISIPCLYEQRYRNHVKYLCKGNSWLLCNKVISTDQIESGRFSISDDPDQRIFTVKINNLTNEDKNFWCAVERVIDVKKHFELSVTTGMPSLYVNRQEITGSERGNVTVVCHCNNPEGTKWCRLGGTCVTAETGSIDGTAVHINTSVPNVFNVMMSELSPESSGWYYCASGDLQMPVHVTVNKLTTASPNTPKTLPTTDKHTSLLTSTEPYTVQPTNSTGNGTGGESLQDENRSFTMKVMILAVTLLPQLFIIPAAFFGLRMIMRKKNKPEDCDTTTLSQVNDPDVLYATVAHYQHVTAQTTDLTPTENPIYSIIVETNVQQTTEPADESVIYTTLQYSKP